MDASCKARDLDVACEKQVNRSEWWIEMSSADDVDKWLGVHSDSFIVNLFFFLLKVMKMFCWALLLLPFVEMKLKKRKRKKLYIPAGRHYDTLHIYYYITITFT